MQPSSRTPEGQPNRCPVCNHDVCIEPTVPPGDAPCPFCGHLLWFPAASSRNETVFKLSEFVLREAIVRDLIAATKAEAIGVLVRRLLLVAELSEAVADGVIAAVMRREELGSTGIGRGIAVPHAKHAAIPRMIGAVGYARLGVEFDSLDGQPVTMIFLLLSPLGEPGDHLRALEQVSRVLRHVGGTGMSAPWHPDAAQRTSEPPGLSRRSFYAQNAGFFRAKPPSSIGTEPSGNLDVTRRLGMLKR